MTENAVLALAVIALMGATVKKIVDFVRLVSVGDAKSVVTQVLAWAVGIAAVTVMAHSAIVGTIALHGFPLYRANWADLTILGISLGSGGSLLTDAIKGVDNTQSAAVPRLGGGGVPVEK